MKKHKFSYIFFIKIYFLIVNNIFICLIKKQKNESKIEFIFL